MGDTAILFRVMAAACVSLAGTGCSSKPGSEAPLPGVSSNASPGAPPSGVSSDASSRAPLPGLYGLTGACARSAFEGGPVPSDVEWCVDAVNVSSDGDLDLLASWTLSGSSFGGAEKGPDAGNRKMYLVDDRGRRYDHYETTEAARFGGRLASESPRLQGSFLFRAQKPGALSFVFHDDDQGVVITVALEAPRRVSPEERAAVAERIQAAADVEIKESWAGHGPPQQHHWRLRRAASGLVGDAAVPAPTAKGFFDLLAQAPLTRGTYTPRVLHTDDYPSLSVRLGQGDQSVEFASQSQGSGNVPWSVRTGGEVLVVPSDHPARALGLLRPSLTGDAGALAKPGGATDPRVDELRLAAQTGDIVKLRTLIAGGVAVNAASSYDGETAVAAAALGGQPEAIALLAAAGAKVDVETPRGRPLIVALQLGLPAVVRALLAAGADPAPHGKESSPLGVAIGSGKMESVRALLEAGAKPSSETALTEAAFAGSVEMARLLLARGAKVDGGDQDGVTPLMAATRNGHADMVEFFLSSGAKVDSRSRFGTTALHEAARNGQSAIARRLLRAGASPHTKDVSGATPLLHAHVPGVVSALLQAGADPNAAGAGNTPLVATVASIGGRLFVGDRHQPGEPDDRLETARLLIAAGANVNAPDGHGQTALMAAASKPGGEIELALIRLLLKAGADPNRINSKGRTALLIAVDAYSPSWVSPFSERGLQSVRALLEAGAVDRPGPDARTALAVAKGKGAQQMAALLATPPAR
jgi:ankyrin repeat protein